MNLDYSIRVKIVATLIALSALISSSLLMMNKDSDAEYGNTDDKISSYEHRFAGLKNAFHPLTVVGYISDLQPDKEIEKYYIAGHYSEHNITEYVLSPMILESGTNHPFVIGNFHKPVNISRVSLENHLILVRDLGNGVMLFRSEGAK